MIEEWIVHSSWFIDKKDGLGGIRVSGNQERISSKTDGRGANDEGRREIVKPRFDIEGKTRAFVAASRF